MWLRTVTPLTSDMYLVGHPEWKWPAQAATGSINDVHARGTHHEKIR